MSKNYAIIIHFMLPLTTFYRSGAPRSDVYKWDAFVTSWRFYNRAWQPQRHDRPPETSGTLWIHRGALTNQRCSLATGCGIKQGIVLVAPIPLFEGLSNADLDKVRCSSKVLKKNDYWCEIIALINPWHTRDSKLYTDCLIDQFHGDK